MFPRVAEELVTLPEIVGMLRFRVSSISLIHYQRKRYSVPTKHANQVGSLRTGNLVHM